VGQVSLTRAEREGLGRAFSVLSALGGHREHEAWRGKPCEARQKRKGHRPCGLPANTVRVYEAAPGMWLHVVLCHRHGYVWDQAEAWGGGIPYRESACTGGCACGSCRGNTAETRYHLWFTDLEVEDLHAGLNHLYEDDAALYSRSGREGIRDMNTQLKAALRLAEKQTIS
jgi:hypothetical protein